MKVDIKFDVRKDDENVYFKQTVEKCIPIPESFGELQKMGRELLQLEQQFQQLSKTLESKQIERDMENVRSQCDRLQEAKETWEDLISKNIEEIKNKIKQGVVLAKAKTGYGRIKDRNVQIIKQNEILAPLCEAAGIDMTDTMVRELKRDFDKL
jgi:endonuclease III|tara:strand:+ start:56 stop:517 length:462 start_codon:yes stop_codon:yes gene_type:complete